MGEEKKGGGGVGFVGGEQQQRKFIVKIGLYYLQKQKYSKGKLRQGLKRRILFVKENNGGFLDVVMYFGIMGFSFNLMM